MGFTLAKTALCDRKESIMSIKRFSEATYYVRKSSRLSFSLREI
jgi:hypothetical protein